MCPPVWFNNCHGSTVTEATLVGLAAATSRGASAAEPGGAKPGGGGPYPWKGASGGAGSTYGLPGGALLEDDLSVSATWMIDVRPSGAPRGAEAVLVAAAATLRFHLSLSCCCSVWRSSAIWARASSIAPGSYCCDPQFSQIVLLRPVRARASPSDRATSAGFSSATL